MARKGVVCAVLAVLCAAALASTATALPFSVPDSLGPFLRFSGRDEDVYTISVLVGAKGPNPETCLSLDFVSGLGSGASSASLTTKSDASLLDSYKDYSLVRWIVTLKMGTKETAVSYKISSSCPDVELTSQTSHTYKFYVPGVRQHWRWGYYSCNGFHNPALSPKRGGGGIKPLWNDLMEQHDDRKLHLIAGNGDQLYNDPFLHSNETIKAAAIDAKSPDATINFKWTPEIEAWTNDWYFSSYAHHWTQASDAYRRALASIPFTMMWDDHDMFNGFGSQADAIRASPLYTGIATVGRRWYNVFQQHSAPGKMMPDLDFNKGADAHSIVSQLGHTTAIVVPDTRGERTPRQVLTDASWTNLREKMFVLPSTIKHLVVLSPMPLALSINSVDQILLAEGGSQGVGSWGDLQEKWMDSTARPIAERLFEITNTSLRPLFGAPDLSDVIDQWDSLDHGDERAKFVALMQEFAEQYGARVTILSGDSHIAFASEIYKNPAPGTKRPLPINDVSYMFAATASAIGNNPPAPLAKLVELTGWTFKENVDKAGTTTVKHRPVFLGAKGLPLGSIFAVARRNWMLVQQPGLTGTLQLQWRFENYTNETQAQVGPAIPRSWTIYPYIAP